MATATRLTSSTFQSNTTQRSNLLCTFIKKPTGQTSRLFYAVKRRLERSLDLFDCVCLHNVTDLDVVVALDVETAVES